MYRATVYKVFFTFSVLRPCPAHKPVICTPVMKLRRYMTLCVLGLVCLAARAQEIRFVNVSNALSVPSPECYNIMQDSRGYIWFSTGAGLCRYNGHSLQVFDGNNGLPESTTYALKEDAHGIVWALTSRNRILCFKDDRLYEAPFSKAYVDFLDNDFAISYRLDFVAPHYLYITARRSSYRIDMRNGRIVQADEGNESSDFHFIKTESGLVPATIWKKRLPSRSRYSTIAIYDGRHTKYVTISKNTGHYSHWRTEVCRTAGYDFFCCDNILVRLDDNLNYTLYTLPERILALHPDRDKGLWVGTYKKGVFHYPDVHTMERPAHGLAGLSVSGICQDRENAVWCSTLDKGIFFASNKNILGYDDVPGLDGSVELFKYEAGKFFVSSGNTLFEIGRRITRHKITKEVAGQPSSATLLDIIRTPEGWHLCGYASNFTADARFGSQRLSKDITAHNTNHSYQFARRANGELYSIAYTVLLKHYKNHTFRIEELPITSPTRTILFDHRDTCWIGTDIGLFRYNLKNRAMTKVHPTGGAAVTKIMEDSRKRLWVSSKGGLYVFTGTDTLNAGRLLGIPTDVFYDITEDRHQTVWAGTNIGLVKIWRQGTRYRSHIYRSYDGLPSNAVFKIAADENTLYLYTPEGMASFPLRQDLYNTVPPNIYVGSILCNGQPLDPSGTGFTFPHDKNSITVGFDALSFKDMGHTRLLYRIKSGGRYQQTEGHEILLDNLAPDTYELEVYALNNDNIKSVRPVLIRFEIRKPFWLTVPFLAGSLLVSAAAVLLIFKAVVKRIRKKEEAKTHTAKLMAEYRLSALQAQMNPHFIFNAINSIQSYVLRKDEKQAYDYLAKFGKLIRMVLNNSEQKILSLRRELELLQLYVQLEQLRFDNSFVFALHIAEDVDVDDVQVPTMLVQPYVENAIWHGIMNLEDKKGILTLNVSVEETDLKITVEDNGVGRMTTSRLKRDAEYRSVGMQLSEKRLTAINQLKDFENARLSVTDLFDGDGRASGTRVEIYIPLY